MSERMAKLYEKAWNETVEGLSDFKKNIILQVGVLGLDYQAVVVLDINI